MLLHLLRRLPFRPRDQVIRVIAVVAVKFSPRQFEHARRDPIEKITVVRHEKAGPLITREKIFEPFDRAGIEMVCRFVENQKIRTRE